MYPTRDTTSNLCRRNDVRARIPVVVQTGMYLCTYLGTYLGTSNGLCRHSVGRTSAFDEGQRELNISKLILN